MGQKLTKEKTEKIMIRYRSDDPKEKEAATMEMIDGLSDFIGNIALKMYKDFARNDQVNEELMQTGKIAIIEALPKYDETKSMPTTFFTSYIISAFYKFVNTEYKNMSLHYAQMSKQIDTAIARFKQKGVKYTIEDLARATGLSRITVENTLEMMESDIQAPLNEAVGVRSDYFAPESICTKKEVTEVLLEGISKLSEEQQDVIRELYMSPSPISEIQAARNLHMTPGKFDKIHNEAIVKLRRNANLVALFGGKDRGRNILNRMELEIVPVETIEEKLDVLTDLDNIALDLDNAIIAPKEVGTLTVYE